MARYRDFDGKWHDVDLPPEVKIVPTRADPSKVEAVFMLLGILVIFLLLTMTQPPMPS